MQWGNKDNISLSRLKLKFKVAKNENAKCLVPFTTGCDGRGKKKARGNEETDRKTA